MAYLEMSDGECKLDWVHLASYCTDYSTCGMEKSKLFCRASMKSVLSCTIWCALRAQGALSAAQRMFAVHEFPHVQTSLLKSHESFHCMRRKFMHDK